jgi:hypothetical protein
MKSNILSFAEFLIEKSGDELHPKRNQPLVFDPKKHKDLEEEFFELISTAYAEIGGHAKVRKPGDVFSDPDWNFWEGIDIHGSSDFDIIMFGSKTRYGIKYAGVGHDGSNYAKRTYIKSRGQELHKLGFYVEASGKIAEILIRSYNVPVVDNQEEVEKVLGKPVEWNGKNPENPGSPGDSWYTRVIGGHKHAKILLGRPKV